MNASLKKRLEVLYKQEEVDQFEAFFDRDGGFSLAGVMALVDFMLEARDYNIPVSAILEGCEKEWASNWRLQDPSIRGSPAAPGMIGIQNYASLELFYRTFLEMSSPLIADEMQIPTASFKVRTRNSVYQFGDVQLDGTRTIAREPKPLEFNLCIVVGKLAHGKSMQIIRLDPPRRRWWTGPILEVA